MTASKPGFFRNVLEASPTPVVVFECRAGGYFVLYANAAFERRTGYAGADLPERDWQLLYPYESDAAELKRLRSAIDAGAEAQAVLCGRCRDGTEFWSELHVAPLNAGRGGGRQHVCMLRDVTREKASREALEHRALHDALTGLPNRYLLQDRLEHAINHARSREGTFAVVVVDLDDFKQVNDSFGHQAGDELLRQVAARLAQALRAGDTIARAGGDEFILLLESMHEPGILNGVLQRLLDLVEQPAALANERIEVRCSLGVSRYPFDGTDGPTLLAEADRAMYSQKARHRRMPYHGERPLPDASAPTLVLAASH